MTAILVDNLTVRRDGVPTLDDVSLAARAGEFIGIVGPNGAGKSTLLRTLAGVEGDVAGGVAIGGAQLRSLAPAARARLLAYLPQAREVAWSMTAEKVVSLGRFAYGAPHRLGAEDRAAVARALAACDSLAVRTRIMTTLSGGEQARIHLARALAAEAPILFADEPISALDLRHQLSIMATLRAKADDGGIVLAALHDLDIARRHCTRLIALDRGRIVADGAPAEILNENLAASVFGVALVREGAFGFRPLPE